MATGTQSQRDVEYNQTFLNATGPSTSQSAGRGIQIAESDGRLSHGLSEQRVEVTVLRAVNIPLASIKKYPLFKRKLFVTVSNPETTAKTADVRVEGQMAKWNQNMDGFLVQPFSHLTLCLYAKGSAHPDILIGTHEMPIPLASQSDIPCVLENDVREAARSTQPVTLYITVNITPPNLYNNPTSIPTEDSDDDSPAEEATIPGRIQFPVPERILPLSHHQPVETGNAMPQSREEMPPITDCPNCPVEYVGKGRREDQGVMDTLSPIAELSPFAKMAHGLLLAIPKTVLEQYQRDNNVQTLLQAIHDAFDFAHHEDTLNCIKPQSEQARILTLMLQHVCSCCDFIQSYTKDSQFWKRTLKNIGGGLEEKIRDLSDVLVKLRKAFLDQATISTEITAFQILDELEKISNQVSDAELDAKIREIPYEFNSRFSPDKGCLMGTRVAFLDFIINWVNNPASERGLVLFGQAGMGKSSIAHEVARLFNKMHRLTSSFIFLRREQSVRKAYHLFTTLARDLADRYPSFKIALGKVVKDNTALRIGTHDYDTLFESLILEPLKDLHIVGPILVVIDALDESGDTTSRIGLHAFLAKNLIRLPSNFRMVITSRPEHAIVSALVEAKSVKVKYMDDTELAAGTHGDILAFFRERLPSNQFRHYAEALAVKAEGLFQWAAVASQLILEDFLFW
ncbi:hypothetical protein V8E52_000074 [Russula decolorans]